MSFAGEYWGTLREEKVISAVLVRNYPVARSETAAVIPLASVEMVYRLGSPATPGHYITRIVCQLSGEQFTPRPTSSRRMLERHWTALLGLDLTPDMVERLEEIEETRDAYGRGKGSRGDVRG